MLVFNIPHFLLKLNIFNNALGFLLQKISIKSPKTSNDKILF
ncbi:hypothetical protein M23134_06494 [Microscilla marina ATCC 23134]|uniref:Uncharacterized protein n=1 Tax=Microscilla marina ATCC 23134 TaxID=313606 RepID=A2A0J1_MICM2|nr:hypothetical protein M23134_06494 [Microscilla marina ATCC 23134]